jgi:hypothetical protein
LIVRCQAYAMACFLATRALAAFLEMVSHC